MRAAIYARISHVKDKTPKDQPTKGKEEAGVDRQISACTELANVQNWEIVATFTDNDISAYSGKNRPGFESLLTAMKDGQFDALIVWHVDRLYRSMKDLERIIDIAEVAGVRIESVNSGQLDLTNSAGKMVARILGSVARQDSEHHAERRRAANEQRALAGQWCSTGSRPFGFDGDGAHREPEASMIRQAVTDILKGTSIRAVARDWNARGVTTVMGVPWTNLHVRRVLTNPRVAALQKHQGKIIGTGDWEPIIDVDLYHGLLAFINDPSRSNALAFERKHLLSGIAKCGKCGLPLGVQYPKGSGTPKVYMCRPTSHLSRRGDLVDALIEAVVLEYLAGGGVGKGLRDNASEVDLGALRTKRSALQAKLDELAAWFASGEIDGSQLRRGSADLRQQMSGVDATLAEAARVSPVATLLTPGEYSLEPDEQTLLDRWAKASTDVKGKIINELMEIVILPAPRGVRTFNPDLIDIRWR
jgi:site-specific DNA recombinase